MAVERRSGGSSYLIMGRQLTYGTHVNVFAAPVAEVTTPGSEAPATAGMIQKRFPFTLLNLDETGEQIQSESIVATGSDTLNTTGILGGAGRIEMEIVPEDVLHILRGVFNPTDEPSDTEVSVTDTLFASASYTAGTALTLTNTTPTTITTQGSLTFPSQVKLVMDADVDMSGTLELVGFRKVGRPDTERFPVTEILTLAPTGNAENASRTLTTENYFTSLTSATPKGDIASGEMELTWEPNTKFSKLTLNDTNVQFPGWTWQMVKGTVPVAGYDVVPTNMSLTIGANIRLAMDLLASEVTNFRMITSTTVEKLEYDTTLSDAALTNFPFSELDFYPPWGGALFFDNNSDPLAFTEATLNVNHNFVPSPGLTGSRFRGQPIVDGDAVREVTMSFTTFFETSTDADEDFIKWQDLYRNNTTFALELNLFNYLDTGRQYRIKFDAPRAQLTAPPTLAIENRGQITRNIECKLIPSEDSTTPDELSVTVWSKDGYTEG